MIRTLLAPALGRIAHVARGPHDLIGMTPPEAIAAVEARAIDAALVSDYAAERTEARGLHVFEIARDPYYLVVPSRVPDLADTEPDGLDAALERTVRITLGSPHADRLANWQTKLLPRAETFVRCRSYDAAIGIVEEGLATTIVPDLALRDARVGEKVQVYALPVPMRRTLLVTRERHHTLGSIRSLGEALREVANGIAPCEHRAVPAFAKRRLAESPDPP